MLRTTSRVNLHLEQLESRNQAGSLLLVSVDPAAFFEISLRKAMDHSAARTCRVRKYDRLTSAEEVPSSIRSPLSTTTVSTMTPPKTVQQDDAERAHPPINQANSIEQLTVGSRKVMRIIPTYQVVTSIIGRFDAGSWLGQSDSWSVTHQIQDASKSALWSSYDAPGSDRADRVNAVAIGTGPAAGRTITAGKQGRIGSIRQYDAAGALVISQFSAPAPGNRKEIVDAATHATNGTIYVLTRETTTSGTLVNHTIERFSSEGGGATKTLIYPPGETSRLEAITVNMLGRPAGLEISVVGTADVGAGYDVVQISHMTTDLTGVIDVFADFGTAAKGLSLATDAAGTRYIGGRYDNGGIAQPLDFDLEVDDLTSNWSHIWSLGSPSNKTSNGFYGMAVIGGQLYVSGSVTDSAFNPAIAPDPEDYDNLFIQHVNASNGLVNAYSFGYGLAGGNYSADGNAVDGSGNQFTAGAVDDSPVQTDPQNLSFGDTSQFDTSGDLVAFRDSGDCDGMLTHDTDGRDIAVHIGGNVAVGGETNASKASFEAGLCPAGNPPQLLNGADASYGLTGSQSHGPPSDGYVFRDHVPVGS